jgi:hypothetical protein
MKVKYVGGRGREKCLLQFGRVTLKIAESNCWFVPSDQYIKKGIGVVVI